MIIQSLCEWSSWNEDEFYGSRVRCRGGGETFLLLVIKMLLGETCGIEKVTNSRVRESVRLEWKKTLLASYQARFTVHFQFTIIEEKAH